MDLFSKKHLSATVKLSEVVIENDAKRKIRDSAFKTAALGHFPPSVMEKPGMVLFLKEIMEEGRAYPKISLQTYVLFFLQEKKLRTG